MKKRTALKLFATALLAGGVLAACSNDSAENANSQENTSTEETEKETETADENEGQTEVSSIEKQVTAYKEMKAELEKMKEDKEVDWSIVSTQYTENLQSEINKSNGEFDQAISAAIAAGESGELEQNVARQIIDKVTQSYFYSKQKSLHKDVVAALEAGNAEEAKMLFGEIKHLANEVFIPTAVKRDEYYKLEGDQSMEQNINAGLAAQEEALNNENVEDYKVFTQLTDKSIYRSYYLAANSYAEKIGAAIKEGASETDLQIKQAEGWGFLQAIKGSLAGGDEQAAAKLDELFSLDKTDAKTIDPAEIDQLFTKAILGKAKSYHDKTAAALEEGKNVDARVKALEGNMFTKMIELELIESLGEEKANQVFEHAEAWFNAVTEQNAEEAKMHSDEVLALLQELE